MAQEYGAAQPIMDVAIKARRFYDRVSNASLRRPPVDRDYLQRVEDAQRSFRERGASRATEAKRTVGNRNSATRATPSRSTPRPAAKRAALRSTTARRDSR